MDEGKYNTETLPHSLDEMLNKRYSLLTYQSDFRYLSTHSVILYLLRMSSYTEH